MNSIQFKITQLRQQNLTSVFQGLFVAFGLQIITQYVVTTALSQMDTTQLTQEPAFVGYVTQFSGAITAAFILYVMITSVMREMKAQKLEKELEFIDTDCCGGACGCDPFTASDMDEQEMAELNEIVDSVVAKYEKPAAKKTAKSKKK